MAVDKHRVGSHHKINEKTIDQWDALWETMSGGFSVEHSELHGKVGIYRADLNGVAQAMGSATNFNQAGLFTRLQTIRSGTLQTGNSHLIAQKIRENIERLTLRVIPIGSGAGLELVIREICKELRKRHHLKKGRWGPQ